MKIKPATLLTAIGMLVLSSCTATEQAARPTAVTTPTTSAPGAEISVEPQTPPALPSDLSGEELLVALRDAAGVRGPDGEGEGSLGRRGPGYLPGRLIQADAGRERGRLLEQRRHIGGDTA